LSVEDLVEFALLAPRWRELAMLDEIRSPLGLSGFCFS
jgi:hypothetical protein